MKLLTLSLLAVAALTAPAFAACQNYPIITPDNAPVSRTQVVTGGGAGNGSLDPRGPRLSSACQSGSTHPWAEGMQREGGACDRMANLKSLSEKAPEHVRAYVTLDGVVADIARHRDGFNSPIAIPLLGVVVGFNPTTGYIPGAC